MVAKGKGGSANGMEDADWSYEFDHLSVGTYTEDSFGPKTSRVFEHEQ